MGTYALLTNLPLSHPCDAPLEPLKAIGRRPRYAIASILEKFSYSDVL
ncbi:MAG: hypothetical protein F6K56_01230 [Moorea sp. SIO3G5]|nr:hypothetical protein [Moorena sp. SIO3G5]